MKQSTSRMIVNIAAFQVCWWTIVLSAARGLHWLPPLVTVLYLLLHLGWVSPGRREARYIAIAATAGVLIDSLLGLLGLLLWNTPPVIPLLCPLWLVCLWICFTSTINCSLGWLKGRYILATIFGILGGPGSYWLGMRFGALEFGADETFTALVVAWAALMPALIWLVGFNNKIGVRENG